MPGRPRKPTAVLKVQGTARKHRHRERCDLELGGELPQPPEFLNEVAREEWFRVCTIGKYAKALSPADRGPLTLNCVLWSELVASQKKKAPAMVTTRLGLYSNLAGRFGMTPCDRAKIQLPKEPKPMNRFAMLEHEEGGSGIAAMNCITLKDHER